LLLGGQPIEDVTKLKKIRVPELNKYLNDHGLKPHLKSSKSDKVKGIIAAGESSQSWPTNTEKRQDIDTK